MAVAVACALVAPLRAAESDRSRWIDPPPEELERALATAAPAAKSALFCALSRAVEGDDMKKAFAYADEAKRTALTPVDDLRADLRRAWVHRRAGDLALALKLARAAETRARTLGDAPTLADATLLVGFTLGNLSEFTGAVEHIQRAITLAESLPDVAFLARAHNVLGNTYADTENLDQALASYAECLRIAELNGLHAQLAATHMNVGNIQTSRKNYAAAHTAYERSLSERRLAGGSGELRSIGDTNINLGLLYAEEGKAAQAIPILRRAVEIHTQLGLKRNLANAHKALAIAFRGNRQFAESLQQFQLGLAIAETLKTPGLMMRFYGEMATTHEASGDLRAALDCQRRAAAAKEESTSQATRLKIEELRASFDTQRREQELKHLNQERELQSAELSRVRWQRISLGAGVLLVAVVLGAITQRQRLIIRTKNRVLAETLAAKQAAEEADRLKTRFLGIASHDIKGPLSNALHFAQELDGLVAAAPAAQRPLDLLRVEVRRVLGRTRDFLDIAALETGRIKLDLTPTDLAELTRSVIEEHRWIADAKGQRITFTADGDGACVGDPARIVQIVSNLLDNAVKYSPPGEMIAVTLTRRAETLTLAVADRGSGLSAEQITQVFTPFARPGTRPTAGESSHGYGLSIAQELARLHGGRIIVQSQPDEGSTFTLELPVSVKGTTT